MSREPVQIPVIALGNGCVKLHRQALRGSLQGKPHDVADAFDTRIDLRGGLATEYARLPALLNQ